MIRPDQRMVALWPGQCGRDLNDGFGYLLDLIGSLCGRRLTQLSRLFRQHAAEVYGGNQAALANGMTIDVWTSTTVTKPAWATPGSMSFPPT